MQRRSSWPARVFLLVLSAPAAFAGDDPAPPMPKAMPETPKVICKYEQPMGTKIRKKTCRTQAVVDAERRASQDWLKRVQDQGALQKKAE